MAKASAPGIAAMAKEGETASATLSRLSTDITTANSWLSMLRQRLFQVGLAGGDAASKLADVFGGLDKLTAASKSFYDTYYSETERTNQSMVDMAKALALVNLALPDSKDALKALAQTLDLNSESGRQAYAVLLTIAPEFAKTTDSMAAAASKLASETAAKLMSTFTGGGQLVPALDSAKLNIDAVTKSMTLIDALPAGASIQDVNKYLAGVNGAPVGSAIGWVNALLTGVNTVPVGAAISGINNTLAMVNGAPVSAELTRVNGYLTGLDSQPISRSIADINGLLGAAPGGMSTVLVDVQGKVSILTSSINASGGLAYQLTDAAGKTSDFAGGISQVNRILGDPTSGVITTIAKAVALSMPLSDAQKSAGLLNDQITALRGAADKTRINFEGLTGALALVDTQTFVNTIGLVFSNLATRISGVINSISAERIAVRDAALSIINPTVMGKDQIELGIAAINVNKPSNDGLLRQEARAIVDPLFSQYAESVNIQNKSWDSVVAAYQNQVTAYQNEYAARKAWQSSPNYTSNIDVMSASLDPLVYKWATAYTNKMMADSARSTADSNYSTAGSVVKFSSKNYTDAFTKLDSSGQQQGVQAYLANLFDASGSVKSASLAYADAMQSFVIDASKSVGKLSKLREETVKYYDAQKKLVDLMTTSAAGIRSTISAYQFSQKTDEQKFQDLSGQFSKAYTLSKITTGESLAGYGDKINALINPMIDALKATGCDNLIGSYLAQAEAVAASVDSGVLSMGNYQKDSLGMLGSIDATLAALDASSQSAEKIISDAVKAGSDKTAAGLHGVIAAMTGQAIPAFASGGIHTGGWRLVGEKGPEMENTGSSQIFNASQTRGMFAGGGSGGQTGNSEMVAELRALRQEVANLRIEARATAVNTGSTHKLLKRVTPNGDSIQIAVAA